MAAPQPPYPQQPAYPQAPYPAPPPQKQGMSCGLMALIAAGLSVPLLGMLAALAIYGVRRYLSAAKTAEAKSTVAAIGRAGSASYAANGALCSSAVPVPGEVPHGAKYQSGAGDYDTGSESAGWKCLRFSLSTPQYYQYQYNQGSGYLGPGPSGNGYEAAARGDLDADGETSVFASTAVLESDGTLELAPQMYIEREFE